jgi:hypothetical protein
MTEIIFIKKMYLFVRRVGNRNHIELNIRLDIQN